MTYWSHEDLLVACHTGERSTVPIDQPDICPMQSLAPSHAARLLQLQDLPPLMKVWLPGLAQLAGSLVMQGGTSLSCREARGLPRRLAG
jgi:hypothetical protein